MFVGLSLDLRFAASAAQALYYERYRFADVFAQLKRAPLSAAAPSIAAIPGVAGGRDAGRGRRDARRARASTSRPSAGSSSIPVPRAADAERPVPPPRPPGRAGPRRTRWSSARRSPARNHLKPGDTPSARSSTDAAARLRDRRHRPLARVHRHRPARRGHAGRPPLRRALDGSARARRRVRHGGRLQRRRAEAGPAASEPTDGHRGARSPARALRRARRASPRALQMSHWTIANELAQLRGFGFVIPVDLPRRRRVPPQRGADRGSCRLQREQIAALKALGYANREIGWHYAQVEPGDRRRRQPDRPGARRLARARR